MKEQVSTNGWISGSGLKVIAVICMILDHSAKYLFNNLDLGKATLFTIGQTKVSTLFIMSSVFGRIAFPLFAFLAVEGYRHTRNLRKYALSLLIFGILTYIPSNAMHGLNLFSIHHSNVMFTLLFGILCIRAIEKLDKWKAGIVCIGFMVLSLLIKTDYRVFGIALIILLYIIICTDIFIFSSNFLINKNLIRSLEKSFTHKS